MINKKYFRHFFLISVLLMAVSCGGQKQAENPNQSACPKATGEVTIVMNDEGYSPSSTNISLCTRVVFQNNGKEEHWPASDLHPTHGIYPEFDPLKGLKPGQQWGFVFDRKGTWKFHDHLHPQIRGIILVDG